MSKPPKPPTGGKGRGGKGPRGQAPRRKSPSSRSDSVGEVLAKSFARQLGTKGGQAVVRGILGTFFGKR